MPKRMTIVMVIENTAPPRPACFPSEEVWHDWLRVAHQSGLGVVRRSDTGKSRGERDVHFEVRLTAQIAYCRDCSAAYRARMESESRCFPSRAADRREESESVGTACVDPAD